MRRWLFARYIRWGAKRARQIKGRLLYDWCDYEPAHRSVKWVAKVDGFEWGQSCTRHVGALGIDAEREARHRGRTMAIGPRERSSDDRTTPVSIS